MTKPLKSGYLLRYKRRLFSHCWREEFIVLYEDSTVAWFKDKSHLQPQGGLVLKEAPELMAVGRHTSRVPDRPNLPQGCSLLQLMAFATANGQKVHWFVAKSEQEVGEWMTAITNTLPLPPEPPIYSEIDEVYIPEIYEKNTIKDCRKLGMSQVSAAAPPTEVEKRSNNVQEMATGVMLAAGFTDWGWGAGLGWNKSWNALYGSTQLCDRATLPAANEDIMEVGRSNFWIHGDNNGSGPNYYDDYNHDNGLDVDFGLDFSF